MTTPRPAARLRELLSSLFVKCAVLVALSTAVVATVLTTQNQALINDVARDGVIASGRTMTGVLARGAGPALRFNDQAGLAASIEDTIAGAEGTALGGLVVGLSGETLAQVGDLSADLAAELAAIARTALDTGADTSAGDGLLMARPVVFGNDRQVVGAVALAWTDAPILTEIAAIKSGVIADAVLAFLAVLAAGTLLLWRGVSVPFMRLRGAMERVAAGDYETPVPGLGRHDEIGANARALDAFRLDLAAAAEAARVSAFKEAGFEGSSAALMLTGRDGRIRFVNPALSALVDALPQRPLDGAIPGRPASDLHAWFADLPARLAAPQTLPDSTDLRFGDDDIAVEVNAVRDGAGEVIGGVIELKNVTQTRLTAAMLDALDRDQARAEFGVDGALVAANANFAAMLGSESNALHGALMSTLVRPVGSEGEKLEIGQDVTRTVRGRFAIGEGTLEGSFCPVTDASGAPRRYIVLGSDVTAGLRRMEEAETRRLALEAAQTAVVDALRAALAGLSTGDLTHQITGPFSSEYESLRHDWNSAIEGLQSALGDVLDLTQTMRSEVSEITSAADDLSRRTEHQAATLEETAASLSEITTAVGSARDAARKAREVVDDARENAETSGRVVADAVSAMGEISESSDRISKIIGVIDDIAFQTNLLALNAGVEAARAGEAGRGFAVVASEVRALAQRSSEAAREINALITSSGTSVEKGVSLVGEAGAALKGIIASVNGISEHVAGIAASSEEQASALTEINSAMGQLDQVTQQNAAMFEETNAASHALARQAETLAASVARFEIGARVQPARAAASAATGAAIRTDMREAPRATIGAAALETAVDDDDWEDF